MSWSCENQLGSPVSYVNECILRSSKSRRERSEGSSPGGDERSRHKLVFGGSQWIRTMMQHTHRRRSSGAAGPISKAAFEATTTGGITATSDRFRQSVPCRNLLLFDGFDVQSQTQVAMRRSLRSAGTVPVVPMRQSTISNLRASATIIVFRVEPRPSAARLLYHCVRPLLG